MMLATASFAQHRYLPENLTDYSELEARASRMHKVGKRSTAPLACVGSPKIPVVLVQFADKEFAADTVYNKEIEHSDANVHAFYESYCNGEGYRFYSASYGSVRDYFIEQSEGQFTPEFVVVGPVTLDKSYMYYGEDSGSRTDININEFYREAITKGTALGVNWMDFDDNNDGKPDFIFFIYAGEGQNAYDREDKDPEHSGLIWPKESVTSLTVDKIVFSGYGCTNEVYNKRPDGVGTMCHELSHGLGLPDFYDTKYVAFGMDYWDMMDAGCYCRQGLWPCAYSAYEREFMGWKNMVELSLDEPATITLQPMSRGGVGYKLTNPTNKNEYYILENRQTLGSDTYLGWVASTPRNKYGANHGLMVTHVDYNESSWTSNSVNTNKDHQRITLLPADGVLISSIPGYTDPYYESMVGDLYPGSKNVASIQPQQFVLFTGGNLPTEITQIIENEDLSITLHVNGGTEVSIEDVVAKDDVNAAQSAFYDLMGRKVAEPVRGIYIKDGKKVFVK